MDFRWLLLLCAFCSSLWAQGVEEQIRQLHERLILGENVEVHGEQILARGIVPLFYQKRDYRPAWQEKAYALSMLELLRQSEAEGLNPEDYHYDTLVQLIEEGAAHNDYLRAKFDFLLTDGLLVYALHLRDGKVDPAALISSWNYHKAELLPDEVIEALNDHIEKRTIAEALQALKPQVPQYEMAKRGMAHFRKLADEADFVPLAPAELPLKPGDEAEVIVGLRQRLLELQLLRENSGSPLYDTDLEQAVKRFQERYGLVVDGVLGQDSFAALNVPYAERADQIRINLDRLRWVDHEIKDDFVLVNIASFELALFRDGEEIWRTDVMTGALNTKTPVFRAEMTYLVLNPTWTVPRGMLGRSMLPKLKADPEYALRNHYVLIDRQGRSVDPLSLDWASLNRNNFPYTLVQQPNENNAMGQVKFMFPNRHAIYLHDTPKKHLFSKSERAFSNGCIRVKDPMTFAHLLLNDDERWSPEQIAAVVAGKKLQNVRLPEPLDVLLMYWTIGVGDQGEIGFLGDIYQRDADVLAALNRPLTQ